MVNKIIETIEDLNNIDEKILIQIKYLKMLVEEIKELRENKKYLNKRLSLCKAERDNAIGKLIENNPYKEFEIKV